MTLPDRNTFETVYAGAALGHRRATRGARRGRRSGEGGGPRCGLRHGENALFFAGRGHPVLGIDYLESPIQEARRKAQERGLDAEFLQMDARTLADLDRRFDSVIDSGLFHVFSDEGRARYVAGLAHVTRPGGRLFLVCFSDEEPGTQGPRRVSQAEIREAFANGWEVEEIRPERFEVRTDLESISFSEGGPRA